MKYYWYIYIYLIYNYRYISSMNGNNCMYKMYVMRWCVVSDFKDHNILSICTSVSENPQFCNSTCIVRWAFQLNCSPAYGLLRISSFHQVEKQTKLPKHIGQTHRMPMSVPGRVGHIRNHNIQHVETYVLFELCPSCLSASNVSWHFSQPRMNP